MKLLATFLTLSLVASARPYIPQLADVPLSQLQAKYAKLLSKDPKNAHNHYVLGRLNAIAYATHNDSFKVNQDSKLPWFGALDPGFPPAPPADPKQGSKLLLKAVKEYCKAVELDPKPLEPRLGYAWCLEQAGRKKEALAQYRKVFAASSADDMKPGGPRFGVSLTEETGRYLLGLLDKTSDAAEIAQVNLTLEKSRKIPRAMTPVLIPMQRGLSFEQLINRRASVAFDLDGTGLQRRWAWPTAQAGWLVYLKNRPAVTSGIQMLGGSTFWIFWKDGYEAMAALDVNDDGWLRGPELQALKVWCDNGDGVCAPSELRSLQQLGIRALATQGRPFADGLFNARGIRYEDGGFGPSYDWMPRTAR